MHLPTFQDWRVALGGHLSNRSVALLIACAVVTLAVSALSIWRSQRKDRRWLLLALRSSAIAACLMVALEPTLELRRMTRVPNHVVVLADVSRSMTVIPSQGGGSRHDRMVKMFDAATTRMQTWRDKGHRLDLYSFGEALAPATIDSLRKPQIADATRLGEAISDLQGRYAGRDLGGIIIVSDGIDTGKVGTGPLDADTIRAAKALGAPIHTIWVGESSVKDLSVASVLADDFAFVRTPITLEGVVRHTGLGGRKVEVTLTRDGRLIDSRTIELLSDHSETKVSFPFTPQQPGNFVFEIATPVLGGEALAENNKQVFALKVIRDRIRVLHVAGRPSWDQRFVRSLLRLNPNVDLVSFFILRTKQDEHPFDERRAMSLIPFPHREVFFEQLSSFDLLVFQNFNYKPYEVEAYLPGVREYVLGGGALAMVGGDLSFAGGLYDSSAIADILPVSLQGVPVSGEASFSSEAYRPKTTREGAGHPITALSIDAKANEHKWAALPPIEGLNRVARLATGASALLEHPRLKAFDGSPSPVLAVADVGKGRSLALMTDSAWQWGFVDAGNKSDGRAFQTFWENAIRWLVRDPALTLLRLELDRVEYRKGQNIGARVRTLHADYTRAAGVDAEVQVRTSAQQPDESPLKIWPVKTNNEGEATVDLGDLATGAYRLTAKATLDGRPVTEDKTLLIRPEGRELEDIVARKSVLAELATQTGGQFVENGFADFPLKPLREERLGRQRAIELWSNPLLMAVAILLLCFEWAIRRRLGHR
jgi:uncharacterized membrane protein